MIDKLVVVSYFFIALFLTVAVHELGHLITGILFGFELKLLVIGPFAVKRNEKDKLVFYLEKSVFLWGGLCAIAPKKREEKNFEKFSSTVIAGPITSLVLGVGILYINTFHQNPIFSLLAPMSIGVSVATFLPMRTGFFYTDGGRWLRMQSDKKSKLIELAIFNVIQSYYENGNYSKLDIDEIQIMIDDDDPRNSYLGHYYSMHFYLDIQYLEEAERQKGYMKSLESLIPKSFIKYLSEN